MALALLHTHGVVYGDQCKMNAVLRKGRGLLLIDFDWCGKEGERCSTHRTEHQRFANLHLSLTPRAWEMKFGSEKPKTQHFVLRLLYVRRRIQSEVQDA